MLVLLEQKTVEEDEEVMREMGKLDETGFPPVGFDTLSTSYDCPAAGGY